MYKAENEPSTGATELEMYEIKIHFEKTGFKICSIDHIWISQSCVNYINTLYSTRFVHVLLVDISKSAIIYLTVDVLVCLSGRFRSQSDTFGILWCRSFTMTPGQLCFCKWSQPELRLKLSVMSGLNLTARADRMS